MQLYVLSLSLSLSLLSPALPPPRTKKFIDNRVCHDGWPLVYHQTETHRNGKHDLWDSGPHADSPHTEMDNRHAGLEHLSVGGTQRTTDVR